MTNFPKTIDFTAWLQAREGICVPEAKVVIHSAFWHEGEGGKPDTQWPDKVEYSLGDTSTYAIVTFATMLFDAISPEDLAKIKPTAQCSGIVWLYNRLNFAAQEQMEPHQYPHLRQRA